MDARATVAASSCRRRSGCQGTQVPERCPADSSGQRTLQRWVRLGGFARLWGALVAAWAEVGGVDGEWPAAAGAMGKARLGEDLLGLGAIRPIAASAE